MIKEECVGNWPLCCQKHLCTDEWRQVDIHAFTCSNLIGVPIQGQEVKGSNTTHDTMLCS